MEDKTKMDLLISALYEIGNLEPDQYRARAYRNAAQTLAGLTPEEFNERKTFLDLHGIGMSINSKILDYKSTGTLPAKLYKLREEQKTYLDPSLYKIRKGFITKRIPYDEAKDLVFGLQSILPKEYKNKTYFLGSFRRNKALIADLDVLVVGEDNYRDLCNMLAMHYAIVVQGPQKTTFVFDNVEKTTMDISWCSLSNLAFQMLHFTGSATNNIRMRARAKELGFMLNQYGLFPNDDCNQTSRIKFESLSKNNFFSTEEAIFEFLGLPYLEPQNR